MKRKTIKVLVVAGFVLASTLVFAQDTPDAALVAEAAIEAAPAAVELAPDGDTVGSVVEAIKNLKNGEILLGIMMVLMVAVSIVRWAASKWSKLSFFTTKAGGYLLTYGGSIAGAVITAEQADIPVDMALMSAAVAAGFTASGGWEAFSDVVTWVSSKFSDEQEQT